MQLDTGTTGSKRQSYVKSSPRAILLQVIEQSPGDSKPEQFRLFFQRLMEAEDNKLIEAIAEYWFANELRNLTRAKPLDGGRGGGAGGGGGAGPGAGDGSPDLKKKLQEHIDRRVQIVLSEMLMPSGVRLRESDKAECERAGGWFTKLAAQMTDGQRVGEAFNEDQLRQAYLDQ